MYPLKWLFLALIGYDIASVILVNILCIPYNHAPVYSFIQSFEVRSRCCQQVLLFVQITVLMFIYINKFANTVQHR